jgi:putative transposase
MKVIGIDVNQKYLACASPSLTIMPSFNLFYINNKTKEFLVNFLKLHEIDIVFLENPNDLKNDIKRNKNISIYKKSMNIVFFIKELKNFLEENGIKVIFVNPRNTTNLCPICNKKLKEINGSYYYLYCSYCNLKMHKDKIASWNILNRGLQKIKGVKN